jgi:hypothetical protein
VTPADQSYRRDAVLSADVAALQTRLHVLTSNKGFAEWGEIFGDTVMVTALIDRLVHHCHIVNIRGNSIRIRHHTELHRRTRCHTASHRA